MTDQDLSGAIWRKIDNGSGLPTQNNVHQVAQQAAPGSRVVYVDIDRCKSGCAHACGFARAARSEHA